MFAWLKFSDVTDVRLGTRFPRLIKKIAQVASSSDGTKSFGEAHDGWLQTCKVAPCHPTGKPILVPNLLWFLKIWFPTS